MLLRRYIMLYGEVTGRVRLSAKGDNAVLVSFSGRALRELGAARIYLTTAERTLSIGTLSGMGECVFEKEYAVDSLKARGINPAACGCVIRGENGRIVASDQEKRSTYDFSEEQPQPSIRTRTPEPPTVTAAGRILPPFGEVFGSEFGLAWQECTYDDLPPIGRAAETIFYNQSTIEAVGRAGAFYLGHKNSEILVVAIPARIGAEPVPCLNIFRYLSYLPPKRGDRGCYTIGVNRKHNVIFPAIFE